MAEAFNSFRMDSPGTKELHPKSPRFPTPPHRVKTLPKRMAKARSRRQKLGEHSIFCAVCNILLNSEFQTREHYAGKIHQNNMSMLGLTPDQPDESNSGIGNSSFCTVCNLKLNSEFQACKHYTGRTHQTKMSTLGLTPDQLIPSSSDFKPSAGPIKRIVTDSIFPSDAKKPKLSASAYAKKSKRSAYASAKKLKLFGSGSGALGDVHLALLHEYRPGLELVIESQPGQDNAPVFTATVEIDGKKYDASASNESLAKSSVASAVFAHVGSHIEEVLTQRVAEATGHSIFDATVTGKPKKDEEDFTSLDDICNSVSFNCFSRNVNSFSAKATNSSGDDPSGNGTYAKSDGSGGNGAVESGTTTTDDSAVRGIGDAKTPAATDLRLPRSSTAILNWVRLGVKRTVSREPSLSDPEIVDYVVTNIVDGKTFMGRAHTKNFAKAYAAEETLVKLFGLKFGKDKRGVPLYIGDTSEIVKVKETMQASALADCDTKLELVDGQNPVALLNEIFQGKTTFRFFPPVSSQWGLEHRCSITVGGMTVEGHNSTKVGAKNRAALAAVAALKAGGMFARLLAESSARRVSLPIQQVFKKKLSRSMKRKCVTEKQPLMPSISTLISSNSTLMPSNSTLMPSNSTLMPSISTLIPSNSTLMPSNSTLKTSNSNLKTSNSPLMPMNPTVRLNSLFPGSKYESQGEVVNNDWKKVLMVAVKVGEKVFSGTGSGRKSARTNAAENALRSLGLWTDGDEESKKLMNISRSKNAQKHARVGLTDASDATAYDFSKQVPNGLSGQSLLHRRAQARDQTLRGQGGGRTIRRRARFRKGLTRGIGAQGQSGGTVTPGQRRASMSTTQGTEGCGSVGILAVGGSYYGSAFSTGLGLGGPSNLRDTCSRVNFIGRSPKVSPGGKSSINANLLKMAHGSNYDIADDNKFDNTSTYDATYNSFSDDPLTDPYATSTSGLYDSFTDPSSYSVSHPTRGHAWTGRGVRRGGRAVSHAAPSVMHHTMSYTQISNEGRACYGVTTQIIRGTRASSQLRHSIGRGKLQSALPATFGTDFFEGYNYDNANADLMELSQGQHFSSYGD